MEQEFAGKSKVLKLRLPAKYFNKDASADDKEIYKTYKETAESIAEKGYGTMVFPAVRDENGNPLFDLEVL